MPRCRLIFVLTLSALLAGLVPARGTERILRFDNPLVQIDTVRWDAGDIEVKFTFTNICDSPVTVLEVRSQCGCFTAQAPKGSIAPGEKGIISAVFNPHTLFGDQTRHLTVVASNGKYRKFNTISVHAYVQRDQTEAQIRYPYELAPGLRSDLRVVGFRLRKAGEKPVRELLLYNDSPRAFTISAKAEDRVFLDWSEIEVAPSARVMLTITLDTSGMPSGEFEELLALNVDGVPAAVIPLKGCIE